MKKIWAPISAIWTVFDEGDEIGPSLMLFTFVPLSILKLLISGFCHVFDFRFIITEPYCWFYILIIMVLFGLYPITVTILWAPIAILLSLLKLIYDVLYYKVFKLE